MGFFTDVKSFFCGLLGIDTKGTLSESVVSEVNAPPTSEKEKDKKEAKWTDAKEPFKFVCNGGKAMCSFCSTPLSDISVTSTTIALQGKPWATVGDKDGLNNLNFMGQCLHPSVQKPPSPPPPCKGYINLGKWTDFSQSFVGNQNALLVQSTILCLTTNSIIRIADSGQRTALGNTDPKTEEPKEKILSIEVLRGDKEQLGGITQYVNLSQDSKFVDGVDIKTIESLGQKIKLKIKFDKPGKFKFKIKVIPDSSNPKYSSAEKNRNSNFNYTEDELDFLTDSNGEKVIEADKIFVTPAGGDVFEISAKDEQGNEVKTTSKIKNERRMYYIEAKMKGLATIASSLSTFTNEYDNHGISFTSAGSVEISHQENIGTDAESDTFKKNVLEGYKKSTGAAKNPYCIAIGYTDHLAVKDSKKRISMKKVQLGDASPIRVDIIDEKSKKRVLWNNIVTGEDWFVECYFKPSSIPDSAGIWDKIVYYTGFATTSIPIDKCTLPNPSGTNSYINIDVSSYPKETGSLYLVVNWVNRMRAGLSFGGTNIVAICTKAWWQTKNDSSQNQVIIHEVGHQLGMVSDSSGILPDKTTNHYTGKGHIGDHCHTGLSVQNDYSSLSGICVMFGSTNGQSAFCSVCAKTVKKIDFKRGV